MLLKAFLKRPEPVLWLSTLITHLQIITANKKKKKLRDFPGGSDGKELACNAGDPGSLGQEDPLEKGMATHTSILARRIPWTEEPGRLQSVGSQRAGHNWAMKHDNSKKDRGVKVILSLFNTQNRWCFNSLTIIRHYFGNHHVMKPYPILKALYISK